MVTGATPAKTPFVSSLGRFIAIGILITLAVALITGFLTTYVPSNIKESGAVLALAGGLTVGIERVLEIF